MRVVATTNAKPVDCRTVQHRIVQLRLIRLIWPFLLFIGARAHYWNYCAWSRTH